MNRGRVIAIAVCVLAVSVLAFFAWREHRRPYQARLVWKESAIPEITRYADDPAWLKREIAMLADESANEGNRILAEPWLSDRMMLMKSGEWLVYRSHCHKEEPHDVEDICIAKGSDGRWYYSTCHFCVRMTALLMFQDNQGEPQPGNLAWFLRNYQFKEFDGRSNECLRSTRGFPENL